jgi:hypothetical protein
MSFTVYTTCAPANGNSNQINSTQKTNLSLFRIAISPAKKYHYDRLFFS